MDVLEARSALGNAAKRGDTAAVLQARRDLATAKIRRVIEESLSSDSAPDADQRAELAALLSA